MKNTTNFFGGTGGSSEWIDIQNKPFKTIDTTDFTVTNGRLSLADGAGGTGNIEIATITITDEHHISVMNAIFGEGNWKDE